MRARSDSSVASGRVHIKGAFLAWRGVVCDCIWHDFMNYDDDDDVDDQDERRVWGHVVCVCLFERVTTSLQQERGRSLPVWTAFNPLIRPTYIPPLLPVNHLDHE